MNIWKLGCNWGTGQQYFDNFIRNEKIVLGWDAHNYLIDDIVLIAKGHKIVAITQITSLREPIENKKGYEIIFDKYNIDYCKGLYYSNVKWYYLDLKDSEDFYYRLQQGMHRVKDNEIKKKTLELFEKYSLAEINGKQDNKFNLREIAEWQLFHDQSTIFLPKMQRGFVWKVRQMESLWDSLFRGYPIGSFLISETEKHGFYYLMDGQQRATSIALGYYNPWIMDRKFWSINNIPVIWMDINPKIKTNSHKYVFRVVTRSHPWGYQLKDNNSTLSVGERRDALKIFRINPENNQPTKGYTKFNITTVFPYDSYFPIPLSFLLSTNRILNSSKNFIEWKSNVIFLCESFIPEYIKTKNSLFSNKNEYLSILRSDEYNCILNDVYQDINKKEVEIKPIFCNMVKLESLDETETESSEDPTLFIRLNSSGTPLSGDELIYSIYKATFPHTKDLIEKIGIDYIKPTQIISIVTRIILSELNGGKFIKKQGVKEFQEKIRKDDVFKNRLIELIGSDEKSSPIGKVFNKAIELLLDNNYFSGNKKFPPVLIKDFVRNNSELFFLLIYWTYKNIDYQINTINFYSALFKLVWFGNNNNEFVKEAFVLAQDNDFWISNKSKEIQRKYTHVLIPPLILYAYFIEDDNVSTGTFELNFKCNTAKEIKRIIENYHNKFDCSDEDFGAFWKNFILTLLGSRSLVAFAQREYLNSNFDDYNQMDDLTDTNVPWDWDHIYPNSWVYYKQVDDRIKRWNGKIGNFRILSFDINRKIQDLEPNKRFTSESEKKESFVNDGTDSNFWNDFEYWNKINSKISFENESIIDHTKAIILRTLNIYRDFYETMKLDS